MIVYVVWGLVLVDEVGIEIFEKFVEEMNEVFGVFLKDEKWLDDMMVWVFVVVVWVLGNEMEVKEVGEVKMLFMWFYDGWEKLLVLGCVCLLFVVKVCVIEV